MARSDSYEEKINSSLALIEQWVEQGVTDKEIADKLGMAYSTYRKYKVDSVALKGAIATGKDKANQEVEKALLKKCLGFKYTEEVATKIKEEVVAEDGQTILVKERVVVKEVKKYCLPDLAAEKFWLINREKVKWKDDPHKVTNDRENIKIKKEELKSKKLDI